MLYKKILHFAYSLVLIACGAIVSSTPLQPSKLTESSPSDTRAISRSGELPLPAMESRVHDTHIPRTVNQRPRIRGTTQNDGIIVSDQHSSLRPRFDPTAVLVWGYNLIFQDIETLQAVLQGVSVALGLGEIFLQMYSAIRDSWSKQPPMKVYQASYGSSSLSFWSEHEIPWEFIMDLLQKLQDAVKRGFFVGAFTATADRAKNNMVETAGEPTDLTVTDKIVVALVMAGMGALLVGLADGPGANIVTNFGG